MGLYELVEYLVRLKLVGHEKVLCALALKSQGAPWSEIYEKCDVDKNVVRAYLTRSMEKVGNMNKALIIIKYVVPLLSDIKPIVIDNKCTICNTNLYHTQVALAHLRYRHRDIVEKYVDEVIERLARRVSVS